METVEDLLARFLKPAQGNSPEAIKERMRHWISVVNDPAQGNSEDKPDKYANAARRKLARQNLRRLIMRHPHIAAQIQVERPNEL